MKQLWAPWRVKYIEGKKTKGCIICAKVKENKDKENYVVKRGDTCFVMMNLYPYNSGHLMICPYRHIAEPEGLNDLESIELVKLLKQSLAVLKKVYGPAGFNVGINIGEVSGAGIEDHIHIHVVPRWDQDTNFMPVVSDTKVISEALEDTYERLVKSWNKKGKSSRTKKTQKE